MVDIGLRALQREQVLPSGELDLLGFMEDTVSFQESMASMNNIFTEMDAYALTVNNLDEIAEVARRHGMTNTLSAFLAEDAAFSANVDVTNATAVVAACEGVLGDWWEKIKAFFAKVWDYIKGFWAWLTSSAVRRMAALKKVEERLNAGAVDQKAWGDAMVKALSVEQYNALAKAMTEFANFVIKLNPPSQIGSAAKAAVDAIKAGSAAGSASHAATNAANQAKYGGNVDTAWTAAITAFKNGTGLDTFCKPPVEALKVFGYALGDGDKLIRTQSEAITPAAQPISIANLQWNVQALKGALDQAKVINDDKGHLGKLSTKGTEIQKVFTDQINVLERVFTEAIGGTATTDEQKKTLGASMTKITRGIMREVQTANGNLTKVIGMYGKGLNMCVSTVVAVGSAIPR